MSVLSPYSIFLNLWMYFDDVYIFFKIKIFSFFSTVVFHFTWRAVFHFKWRVVLTYTALQPETGHLSGKQNKNKKQLATCHRKFCTNVMFSNIYCIMGAAVLFCKHSSYSQLLHVLCLNARLLPCLDLVDWGWQYWVVSYFLPQLFSSKYHPWNRSTDWY